MQRFYLQSVLPDRTNKNYLVGGLKTKNNWKNTTAAKRYNPKKNPLCKNEYMPVPIRNLSYIVNSLTVSILHSVGHWELKNQRIMEPSTQQLIFHYRVNMSSVQNVCDVLSPYNKVWVKKSSFKDERLTSTSLIFWTSVCR